jgi:nucleoside-diphosphate-sugar epimerase
MRVFIAGATGVVGRRLVPTLVAAGHQVTGPGRTPERRAVLQGWGARPVEVDLFDADAVRRAVAEHDVVINLATHIPPSSRAFLPGAWLENDRIRRYVSANLAGAVLAGGASRFIQESFAPAYPDSADQWIGEETPLSPTRSNRSILDAEAAAHRVAAEGRIGIVLRFALFYGPDSDLVRDSLRFIRNGWAPFLGGPDGFISMVSHDDAATAVSAVLTAPAGTYNVVEDDPMRRGELASAVADRLGVPPPRFLPAWAAKLAGSLGETLARSLRISNRKLKGATGWAPRYGRSVDGWRQVLAALDGAK